MEKLHSAEMGAALQELLDAPLEATINVLGLEVAPAVIPTDTGTARTLLAHPSPPMELLDAVYLAAQQHSKVPRSVADVIQLAALSVAIQRCGLEVPAAEHPTFRGFYEIAIGLTWVDEATREILDDGLAALTPYDHTAPPVDLPKPASQPAATAPAPNSMRGILSEMARIKVVTPEKRVKVVENEMKPMSLLMTLVFAVAAAAVIAVPMYLFMTQDDDERGPEKLGGIDSGQVNRQVDARK